MIVGGTIAVASGDDGIVQHNSFSEQLSGYEEDPLVLSTTGNGQFRAQIGSSGEQIAYTLSYSALATQACPAAPATIEGVILPADVIGPDGHGVTAGQFDEVVAAMRAGVTYVDVHSSLYQGGEIRAQLGDHVH